MMKVLLVYANQFELLAPPPVGLGVMVNPLRKAGHDVRIIEFMREKDPDALLDRTLVEFRPDITGFSLRNLDDMSLTDNHNFVPDYVRWVKRANRVSPTIIGGSAVAVMPEALYERTGATWALSGQGDKAFPLFLEELRDGRTSFTTPGIMWRENGAIRLNPGLFDGYRGDGRIEWSAIDRTRYKKSYMKSCVLTKSGCPHRCLFCDVGRSFGEQFVPREPEAIVEDLRRDAREYGMHRGDYFFVDALFNQPADWAKRLCEALIRLEHDVPFYAIVEPTPDFDAELAGLMRRAGCVMATTLVGSVHERMIERMTRPFALDDVHRCFRFLQEARVPYMVQYMWGGPGETRETILENFRQAARWKTIMSMAMYGLRILPGAGLFAVARDEGVIDDSTDLLEPTFYLSEPLRADRAWLDQQVKRMNRFRLHMLPQWASLLGRTMKAARQKRLPHDA
jgi:radical SAM superfamily enzyme YgiQ (UPF0313 family)